MGASRRILALLALASVPAMAACQLVLGLNDYTEGPADSGGGLESGAPDASDGGFDSGALPDVFSSDVAWARWRMPNPSIPTDSGANYNSSTFTQIGVYTPDGSTASYPVFTDHLLADPEAGTSLQWIFPQDLSAMTQEKADAECAARGARLPSRIELVTLIDFSRDGGRQMPGLGGDGGLKPQRYWSRSPVRPFDGTLHFWTVSFSDGNPVAAGNANDDYFVACLRGK